MQRILSNSSHREQRLTAPLEGPRVMCSCTWPGMAFRVEEQNISQLTTWRITHSKHTVVVHLRGSILRLETELPGANGCYPHTMPGEVWVVPANTAYASLALGEVVRFAELHVDAEQFSEVTGVRAPQLSVLAKAGHYDGFLHRAVERLAALSEKQDDLSRLAAHGLSHAVYLHVFQAYGADSSTQPPLRYRQRLTTSEEQIIREYVQEHLGVSICLEKIRLLVGMKMHPFLAAFRSAFGTTPAQYIIDQRLRRARHLLSSTDKDITDIAYETGFSSHAHFSSVFRSRTAMTPRDFRRSRTR